MITRLNILQMMYIANEVDNKTKTNKPFVTMDSWILDLDINGVITQHGGSFDISFSSVYDESIFRIRFAHIINNPLHHHRQAPL